MDKRKIIGDRIKKMREAENMSQDELASLINSSSSAISMYENGSRLPNDEKKVMIAKVFKTSVESIFFTF